MSTDFKPHPSIHSPWMFMCAMDDPDAAIVSVAEKPAAQIASALLEDVGDWHHAVKNLQKAHVPPAVTAALNALHEAVCGWTEWNEQSAKRGAVTP